MLEKPHLKEEKIIACLKNKYELSVDTITFLPIGADLNTAAYRVITRDEKVYFVKLRREEFTEASVTVPRFLSDLGIKQIIAPLTTQTGQLWANLYPYKVSLYPFVKGHNGFEINLSDRQWIEFGAALKRFHTAKIPPSMTKNIHWEKFSPHWRNKVKKFLKLVNEDLFDEPVAAEMAAFLKNKRDETLSLVQRSETLAQKLNKQPLEFILCHADIHGWNLLIEDNGDFYMVDWDTLIFAPKERDLMFVGGGLVGTEHTSQEEETLFYQGYGQTKVDPIAIAYYRSERIVEDIAVYCEQIFLSDKGGEDRKQSLINVKSNYLPNGRIEIASQ